MSDLSPLAELNNLEALWLFGTQVSDEQLQELRQALPNCTINHWQSLGAAWRNTRFQMIRPLTLYELVAIVLVAVVCVAVLAIAVS